MWLRAFLEVARLGSFTGAARTLGWTQSAVSRQISTLEGALGGAPLFDRLPRGVRLTEAGRVLMPYAEAIAESLHGAVRELAALREVAGGRLRFGAFATADAGLVPQALAAFRAAHPRVQVTREEGFTPALLDRLTAGHLDLAVVSTTGRAPLEAYELHHLLDESLYVAVPAGHPLAGSDPVRLGRLADAEWISGSSRPEGTLLDVALRQGFRPRVAHVVGEWTAKQGYVAAGLRWRWSRRWPRRPCARTSGWYRCWTRAGGACGVRGDDAGAVAGAAVEAFVGALREAAVSVGVSARAMA